MELTEKELYRRRQQAMREAAEMHKRQKPSSHSTSHEVVAALPPAKKENAHSNLNNLLGNLKIDKDLALLAILAFILLKDEHEHNALLIALLYILL